MSIQDGRKRPTPNSAAASPMRDDVAGNLMRVPVMEREIYLDRLATVILADLKRSGYVYR